MFTTFSKSLDVNYVFVTERAYSHSGRHEMNLDDEGFTEMSDCVWEELRMGGGLKECSVLCLITPLCVTRTHTHWGYCHSNRSMSWDIRFKFMCVTGVCSLSGPLSVGVYEFIVLRSETVKIAYVFSSRRLSPQWQVSDRKQSQDCSCICSLAKLHVA